MARKNSFIALVSKKAKMCKGQATKADVNKAAATYIKETVKKGNKTKAEATKIANRIKNRGCSMSPVVAGKKKKRRTAKKKK